MQKNKEKRKKENGVTEITPFPKYGFCVFFAGLHSQWYKSGLFLTVFNGFYCFGKPHPNCC